MTRGVVLLLGLAAIGIWIVTVQQWASVLDQRRDFFASAHPAVGRITDISPRRRMDQWLRTTAAGRWFAQLLERSAVPLGVFDAAVVLIVTTVAAVFAAGLLFTQIVAVAVALAVPFVLRAVLRGRIRRRADLTVDQLPELSAMLSGSAAAGLSMPLALRLAADDLPQPLAGEPRTVLHAISIGASTDAALEDLARRVPSREMTLFVSTVVVQTRGGGDMVKALRRLTESLEARRENAREYVSLTAGSTSTAYLMLFFGVGMAAMLNQAFPGALDRTLASGPGRFAVIGSVVLYSAGLIMVRRAAREPL